MYVDELQRVFLVDDEADIRELATLALGKVGGLTVHTCADSRQALAEAEQFAPHLILLDVMMPGLDGTNVLAQLKAHPTLREVPVVFLTAKAQPDEVARYHQLGAFDVIRKPFDAMQLPEHLARLWEAWKVHPSAR